MVKRALLALLLVLACSATLSAQGLAAATEDESSAHISTFWRPWGGRKGLPPLPSHGGPGPDPKTAKCMEALKSVTSCLKPPIGAECCAALKGIQGDCAGVSSGPIGALLDPLIKSCGGGGGTPASTA